MLFLNKILTFLNSKQKRTGIKIILLMLIGMVLETAGIGMIIPAIALMSNKHIFDSHPQIIMFFSKLSPINWYKNSVDPESYQVIGGAMIFLLIVVVIKTIFFIYLSWSQVNFVSKIQLTISHRLYSSYLKQDFIYHLQNNSALLIRNVTSEVYLFSNVLTALLIFITELFILIGITILLFISEPFGTFIVIIILFIAIILFQKQTKEKVLNFGRLRQFHEGKRMQHLQQGLGGVKDVKLMGREENFINEFSKHNITLAEVSQKVNLLQSLPRLWLELLAVIGLVLLIFSILIQGKNNEILIPTISLFAASAFRLMPSANRIINSLQNIRFTLPVIDTLTNEFNNAKSLENIKSLDKISNWTNIYIENLSFQYPNTLKRTLDGISLKFEKGKSYGFIGESGAGKSTLIDIILGLLKPTSGVLKTDKNILCTNNIKSWQKQIGYVPQHIYLTDDTLRNNIAFGLSDIEIDDQLLINAAKEAQLYDFIESLPDGLNTMVGERGTRLSGGQRQRIGIARALYHMPTILVLDEATSALDINTEEEVMNSVNKLKGTKTIFIIAHRYTTISKCDWLIHLENGKILREGIFKDLIKIES
jgi:ABC-type multidrug transport system fused ATPase/permease subunit